MLNAIVIIPAKNRKKYKIAIVAAFVEADAALRKFDEVELAVLQLEHIHIRAAVNRTGVEQELVRRN